MKYAVVSSPHGIIQYLETGGKDHFSTVLPARALLFNDLQEASVEASRQSIRVADYLKSGAWKKRWPERTPFSAERILGVAVHWVEAIENVAEFRAMEDDTW